MDNKLVKKKTKTLDTAALEAKLNRSPISRYGIDPKETILCGHCGKKEKSTPFKVCLRCKQLGLLKTHEMFKHYCSRSCQVENWKRHRHEHKNLESNEIKLRAGMKHYQKPNTDEFPNNSWLVNESLFSHDDEIKEFHLNPEMTRGEAIDFVMNEIKDCQLTKFVAIGGGQWAARIRKEPNLQYVLTPFNCGSESLLDDESTDEGESD